MRRPNFILSILGMLILAFVIFICSFIYWLVSNIIAIVVGMGAIIIFVFFLGRIYSYFKDTKIIQENFDGEKADELILSLRKMIFVSIRKFLILMLMYGLSWGIIICFLQAWML